MLISIIISLFLGFLTGLGTGGGSLLIVWLTVVCGIAPAEARLVNLMFFIPCAAFATLRNLRNGHIRPKELLSPILSGCIAALCVTLLSQKINTEQLQKLFGVLLLFTGVRELLYRERKAK